MLRVSLCFNVPRAAGPICFLPGSARLCAQVKKAGQVDKQVLTRRREQCSGRTKLQRNNRRRISTGVLLGPSVSPAEVSALVFQLFRLPSLTATGGETTPHSALERWPGWVEWGKGENGSFYPNTQALSPSARVQTSFCIDPST